jgi:hypothetical protein
MPPPTLTPVPRDRDPKASLWQHFCKCSVRMERATQRKRVLVVDCDARVGARIKRDCKSLADVEVITSFPTARRRVLQHTAALLVTNLRLAEYNGLHLVYLASADTQSQMRCLVYSAFPDLTLIEEAQAAGAFYERVSTLAYALPSYISSSLPQRDKRLPLSADRRRLFRGGRRAADVALLSTC